MLRTMLPKIVTGTVPGPKSQALFERKRNTMPNALFGGVYPVTIARGEGAMFEDLDGNVFLDFLGGIGVLNIGYSHPEVIEALKAQTEKYFHTLSVVVTHEGMVELSEVMSKLLPCKGGNVKTFFMNSGAEADENAIKVAKAYTKRSGVICFTGAFHGRTHMTMELTANKNYSRGMGPFPSGVYRADFPSLYRAPKGYTEEEAIAYYVAKLEMLFQESVPASDVAAIIVEPMQGEGGFTPVPIAWVQAVRKLCDKYGIVLIADEVQCGNCRTGKFYASEYWAQAGAAPDIITTAKSMGAGSPISAIAARAEIMDSVAPAILGGTYSGNPLSCASALKVMEVMQRDDFPAKARHIGEIVTARYASFKEKYAVVGDYRGLGAMIGIEFVKDRDTKEPYPELVNAMVQKAIQKGLIIENCGVFGNAIRFLAPLVITDEQLNCGLDIMESCLQEALAELA